jgi:hypothetical protein
MCATESAALWLLGTAAYALFAQQAQCALTALAKSLRHFWEVSGQAASALHNQECLRSSSDFGAKWGGTGSGLACCPRVSDPVAAVLPTASALRALVLC